MSCFNVSKHHKRTASVACTRHFLCVRRSISINNDNNKIVSSWRSFSESESLTWSLHWRPWVSSVPPEGSLFQPAECWRSQEGCLVGCSPPPPQWELICFLKYMTKNSIHRHYCLCVYSVVTKIISNNILRIIPKLTFSQRPWKQQQQQGCREQSGHHHHGRWSDSAASSQSQCFIRVVTVDTLEQSEQCWSLSDKSW